MAVDVTVRLCAWPGCVRRCAPSGRAKLCATHVYRKRHGLDMDAEQLPRTPGVIHRGVEHPSWKGEGYNAAHERVKRRRGAASSHPCATCGETARDWALFEELCSHLALAGPGYREGLPYCSADDPSGCYVALCRACHNRRDHS